MQPIKSKNAKNKQDEIKELMSNDFKENEIEYKIKDDKIIFNIKLDNIWLDCYGIIYKNRITKFNFYKDSITIEESNMLKKYITSSYPKEGCINYDEYNYTLYTTYPSAGYKLFIRLENSLEFSLNVSFEDEKHRVFKYKMSTSEIIEYISIIVCAVLGLLLTIQFIYMYMNNYDKDVLVISAIISYLYMAISIFIFCFQAKVGIKKNILWPIF